MTPALSNTDPTPSALPLVPVQLTSPLDLFARLLAHKLRYLPGERDSVLLSHEIISRPIGMSKGQRQDMIHTSTLLLRQPSPQVSAMAMTVSLPLAIAALRVLDGHVHTRGVAGPTADKDIYRPVLQEMGTLGLTMKEENTMRLPGRSLADGMIRSV
jgi:alpha-aminoadipic semialdehyde synthase